MPSYILFLQRELFRLETAVYLSSVPFSFISSILVWFTLFASLLTATLGDNSCLLPDGAPGMLGPWVALPLCRHPTGSSAWYTWWPLPRELTSEWVPPGPRQVSQLVTREELGNGKA